VKQLIFASALCSMTMSNIRTFADELRAAVEQAAVKRANERPAKRLCIASENGNWHSPTPTIATVATVGTAGTAGAATAMLAATQMPPQERTTFPVSNPASISLQTPEPDGGKAVTEQKEKTEKTEKTENKNTQNTETAEATTATENTKDAELNGSAKAPNKKTPIRQTSFEERLDAFVGNLDLSEVEIEDVPLSPEEQSRKDFADRLDRRLDEESLGSTLEELNTKASSWGALRRMRSIGLLLVHVSRSSRACRAAFVAKGLPLLGELLTDSVGVLEEGPDGERHEATMRCMACLACLLNLSVGRAIMWEHRQILGKPFDRLHRWCGREKTARAADLRGPCTTLSRRWQKQAKPASSDTPQNKATRVKVLEMIKQGLEGADAEILKKSLPLSTVASEIEASLYGFYKGATPEYRHHARMLRNNMILVGNESLRERILFGEIVAQDLVNMDSRSLAPQSLQEQRRAAELEALKSVVLPGDAKQLEPPPASFDWRDETWRVHETPSTTKEATTEAQKPSATSEKGSESQSQLEALATPATPISEPNAPIMRTSSYGAPGTPEAMATPAPDDEDEQAEDLIRFFSQPVLGH